MSYAKFLEEGKPEQALAALQDEARRSPGNVDRWVFMFALECVLGRLEKALGCLQKAASLDEAWVATAQENRMLIGCEKARRAVFQEGKKPLILGTPAPWVACYVEALARDAENQAEEAARLRATGRNDSPAIPGKINGQPSEWLADADERFGPILEAYLDGRYYWIPFDQVESVECRPAEVLIELVWLPATLKLVSGVELRAYLPVRYPGSENSAEGDIRLARRTEWRSTPGGGNIGLGQRMLEGSNGDFGLLECRTLELSHPDKEPAPIP